MAAARLHQNPCEVGRAVVPYLGASPRRVILPEGSALRASIGTHAFPRPVARRECIMYGYHECTRSTEMGDRLGNFSYLTPPHADMRHLLPWLAHGYIRTRVRWDEPSCRSWERVHGG